MGFTVADTHQQGGYFPDFVIGFGGDYNLLVEVKSEHGKPSPGQQKFIEEFGGPVCVAYSTQDVLSAMLQLVSEHPDKQTMIQETLRKVMIDNGYTVDSDS